MTATPKVQYPDMYKLHKLQNKEFTSKCLAVEESALERDLRLLLNIVKRRKGEPDVEDLTPYELVDNLGSLLGLTKSHRYLELEALLRVIYGYVKGRGWTNYNKGILPACETMRSAVRLHLESLN
jgi:hypothetical protein